ncbi:MAG: hypothetical protein L3K15_01525 [Thermoplasmata archaeon]|nr:hypothetical protein [Thermoplasmata archaeon]
MGTDFAGGFGGAFEEVLAGGFGRGGARFFLGVDRDVAVGRFALGGAERFTGRFEANG